MICICIVTVLLAILSKPAMNEIFLVLVSYVIIITFLAIEICLFFAGSNRYVYVFFFHQEKLPRIYDFENKSALNHHR